MKTFLILCVILVAKIHAEFISVFPKEYDDVVDACRMETGYTDEVVAKKHESYLSEDGELRIFNYCFLEKTGFVTRDGKLNIDDALAKLTPSNFKTKLQYCNMLEKNNPWNIFSSCFHTSIAYSMRFSKFSQVIEFETANFTQIVDACRMETGYTDEVIAEEEKSNLKEDAGLKKFNNCFIEKSGHRGTAKFDIDDALVKIPQRKVTKIIESCESKTAEKIIPDSAPFLSACLHLGVLKYFRDDRFQTANIHPETDHVTQIIDICRMETGFTDEVLHKEKESNFTEEGGLRKFNNCFLQKTGFITSDGKLNIDAALAKLPLGFAKPIIEHCHVNIILKYTTETVYDFSTCYLHGVQNHIIKFVREPFAQTFTLVLPGFPEIVY